MSEPSTPSTTPNTNPQSPRPESRSQPIVVPFPTGNKAIQPGNTVGLRIEFDYEVLAACGPEIVGQVQDLRDAVAGLNGRINQLVGAEFLLHAATAVRKNRDYGSSVFQDVKTDDGRTIPAVDAIQVRIQDKRNRLATLMHLSEQSGKVGENVADTYRDWSVYVALLGMLRNQANNGLAEALRPTEKSYQDDEPDGAMAASPAFFTSEDLPEKWQSEPERGINPQFCASCGVVIGYVSHRPHCTAYMPPTKKADAPKDAGQPITSRILENTFLNDDPTKI